MRKRYRETAVVSNGSYMTVQIYPELSKYKHGKRRTKFKPTSETQKKINYNNRKWNLIHVCNDNFTTNDLKVELTYDNLNHPESIEQAKKDFRNFIKRINRARKKAGLLPTKYFQVLERGERKGRFHHHVILSGDLSINEIQAIWRKGTIRATPLRFDEQTGLRGLVSYMLKKAVCVDAKATYSISRNMKRPKKPSTHAGRISQREIEFMASYTDTTVLERLYPGFALVTEDEKSGHNPDVIYNKEFDTYFFFVQLYRKVNNK